MNFPVPCAGEAPAKFHRAMALYHSFAWKQGKAAFDEIASLDPRCGMAYWGLAMIAADNPFGWLVYLKLQEGAEALQKAQDIGAATPRERDYIAALTVLYKDHATVPHRQRALAYEQAMEKLAATYPDDLEAKLLAALAVSANHDLNDKTFARPLKAAGLVEPLFASYPQHPGAAHYLIHSYDYPPIASKGVEAAKRYSQIPPDAAHAQHMPSHIFTRVGAWRESVASNQASVVAAKGDMRSIPHGWDYMVYAYLQMADDAGADKVGAEARAIHTLDDSIHAAVFGVTAIAARLALERGRWAEAATLEQTMQMFAALDITNEAALNDLAAFLADADPRRYTIKGTIRKGLIPEGMEVGLFGVAVCSDYNPPAATGPFAFSPLDANELTYEVKDLRPGEYTVLPEPPLFFEFQPLSHEVVISFLATGIVGCAPPDCTPPPVCSTDVTPVDFKLHFSLLVHLIELQEEVVFCKICPEEMRSLLLKKINPAIRQLQKEHYRPAVNLLRQFVRDTERFIRKGQLLEAEGQGFIAEAEAIIEQIEGQVVRR